MGDYNNHLSDEALLKALRRYHTAWERAPSGEAAAKAGRKAFGLLVLLGERYSPRESPESLIFEYLRLREELAWLQSPRGRAALERRLLGIAAWLDAYLYQDLRGKNPELTAKMQRVVAEAGLPVFGPRVPPPAREGAALSDEELLREYLRAVAQWDAAPDFEASLPARFRLWGLASELEARLGNLEAFQAAPVKLFLAYELLRRGGGWPPRAVAALLLDELLDLRWFDGPQDYPYPYNEPQVRAVAVHYLREAGLLVPRFLADTPPPEAETLAEPLTETEETYAALTDEELIDHLCRAAGQLLSPNPVVQLRAAERLQWAADEVEVREFPLGPPEELRAELERTQGPARAAKEREYRAAVAYQAAWLWRADEDWSVIEEHLRAAGFQPPLAREAHQGARRPAGLRTLPVPRPENPLLAAALAYARRGWAVLPCEPRGKRPLVAGGYKAASKDPNQIRAWWAERPQANVGIATGAVSGLVVLDIDPRAGGEASLRALQEKLGPFPLVAVVRTGGGGRHLYFRIPPNTQIPTRTLPGFPGVEVKGEGAYVIAPPSLHPSGGKYVWELEPGTP